jgi:DNA-binding MarR family transcriptional regulator
MVDHDTHTTGSADDGELAFLIGDAARLLRSAFERRIAKAGLGLTPGEARALVIIAATDGSRQLDIAQRMGVEPMTLCAYLDRLEALDLVERQPCTVDRRAKRVILTAASADILCAIREQVGEIAATATEGLDLVILDASLRRLNANLQAANQAGRDEPCEAKAEA